MSGIYIHGLEMPKTYPLKVTICPDGQVLSETVGAKHIHGTAVPVPPHGRLIDADALLESEHGYTIPNYNSDGYVADSEGAYTDVQIENASTIIPANKEGET